MKALLDAGLIYGDCLTVTGKTVAENLADIAPPDPDGKILRALDHPIHKTGGITILDGSLAPLGAVVKSAGFDDDVFTGTARVFERERAALDALEDGTITDGDVVVIRYQGPKGGPGMRAMLPITGAACAWDTSPPRPSMGDRSLLCETATRSASTWPTACSTSSWTRTSSKIASMAGSRCRPSSPRVCWVSTSSLWAPPHRGPCLVRHPQDTYAELG